MLNLSSIIRKPGRDPVDDFRIVRSWKEYTDDRKYMKYLMYELEMLEENGNIVHFYKAVKFTRIIRLPILYITHRKMLLKGYESFTTVAAKQHGK